MQRIFAFDPGTSAIGWAVLDIGSESIEIVGAGVRLFALARQKTVQKMRQRLKPEHRMKLRQRMKLRRKDLEAALIDCGLLATDEEGRDWERDDGIQLAQWLSCALAVDLPAKAIVRILFNAHKHRGALQYGPEQTCTRDFVARFLKAQSIWHDTLSSADCREKLERIIFRRRTAQRQSKGMIPVSPLAKLAHREFKTVWHALISNFGLPTEVRIEAAVPASRKSAADLTDHERLAARLADIARAPTRQNLLRARLFERQSGRHAAIATCPLTDTRFDFPDAFSPLIEIDHIHPAAKGGKGGKENLALCLASANRTKGAASATKDAVAAPRRNPVQGRADIADADALRQAVKMATAYVRQQSDAVAVRLISPKAVSDARNEWLNGTWTKDRSDLRHHAVDAIVIAALPNGKANANLPDEGFASNVTSAVKQLLVSIKPEHGVGGPLHDETRYGRPSAQSGFDATSHVTSRKAVGDLTGPMLKRIVDPSLRRKIHAASAKAPEELTGHFGRTKRLKIARKAGDAIDILDEYGRFKAAVLPADNHHLDIVQMRDGIWHAFGATRHAVSQPDWRPRWEQEKCGGKLVMRLHKGDMVELQGDGDKGNVMTVIRLSASSGMVHLGQHFASGEFEGGSMQKPNAYAPRSLQKRHARAVHVDAAGRMTYRASNVDKVRTRLIGASRSEP